MQQRGRTSPVSRPDAVSMMCIAVSFSDPPGVMVTATYLRSLEGAKAPILFAPFARLASAMTIRSGSPRVSPFRTDLGADTTCRYLLPREASCRGTHPPDAGELARRLRLTDPALRCA